MSVSEEGTNRPPVTSKHRRSVVGPGAYESCLSNKIAKISCNVLQPQPGCLNACGKFPSESDEPETLLPSETRALYLCRDKATLEYHMAVLKEDKKEVFLDLPLSKVLSGDIKYDINKQWHQLTVQSSGVHPPRHLVFLLHSPSSDHKEAKDFNSKLEAVLEEILTAHTSQGEKAAQGDPNSSATQDASHLQKASVTQAAGIMTEPSYVAVSQIASRQSMSTLQGQPGLPATAVEQTAMALAVAIQMGEVATAEKLAAMLAQGHTNVSVTFDPAAEERRAREQEISVTVHVEDRQSVGLTLDDIKVRASDTILDLKRQFLGKYNFPVEVQKWIIGRRIPGDEETLSKCDVTTPGHTLYLYLLNARAANLSRDDGKRHRQGQISSDYETMNPPLTAMRGVQASVTTPMSGPDQDPTSQMVQGGPLGTGGANRQQSQLSAASSTASLGAASFALSDFRANLEPGSGPNSGSRGSEGRGGSPGAGKGGLAEGGGVAQSLLTAGGGRAVDTHTLQAPPQDFTLNQELGWSCPQCTFINQPTRPGCEICGSPRPTDYQVPSDVIVSDEERDRLAREQQMEVYLQQPSGRHWPQDMGQGGATATTTTTPHPSSHRPAYSSSTKDKLTAEQLDLILRFNDALQEQLEGSSVDHQQLMRRGRHSQLAPSGSRQPVQNVELGEDVPDGGVLQWVLDQEERERDGASTA